MWKIGQKCHPPLWPWPWPGDLDTGMVSWPCLGLPTRWIWWPNTVIKGVKWCVKGLTFDLEYLTLRAKIQDSALTDLSAHAYAFLASSDENCTTSSKKCQKMAKIDQFMTPGDLDLDGVTLTIVPGSHFFLGAYTYQVSSRSENGKGVKTLSRTDAVRRHGAFIYLRRRR